MNEKRGNRLNFIFAIKKVHNFDSFDDLLESSRKFNSLNTFEEFYSQTSLMQSNFGSFNVVIEWLRKMNVNIVDISESMYIVASASRNIWKNAMPSNFERNERNGEIDFSIPFELKDHLRGIWAATNLKSLRNHFKVKRSMSSSPTKRKLLDFTYDNCASIQFLRSYYNITSTNGQRGVSQAFLSGYDYFSRDDLHIFQQIFRVTRSQPIAMHHGVSRSCDVDNHKCFIGNLGMQYLQGLAEHVKTYNWFSSEDLTESDVTLNPLIQFLWDISKMSNTPDVLVIPWSVSEKELPSSLMQAFCDEVMMLSLAGTTVIAASGDDGVSGDQCNCYNDSSSSSFTWGSANAWSGVGYFPSFPASCPYVTAVGSTMGPVYNSDEIVASSDKGGIVTSGGGFSTYFSAPSWQHDAIADYFVSESSLDPGFNSNGRGYPDVSLLGVEYPVVVNGDVYRTYGSAASAILFGSMISLINSNRRQHGLTSVGFINDILYQAGANISNSILVYNDITSGNNSCCSSYDPGTAVCCGSGFTATPGWDPVSGWGSVHFTNFQKLFIDATYSNEYVQSASTVDTSIIGFYFALAILITVFGLLSGYTIRAMVTIPSKKLLPVTAEAERIVNLLISKNSVVLFSLTTCDYCKRTDQLLKKFFIRHIVFQIDKYPMGYDIQCVLRNRTNQAVVPYLVINTSLLGGAEKFVDSGVFEKITEDGQYMYLSARDNKEVLGSTLIMDRGWPFTKTV